MADDAWNEVAVSEDNPLRANVGGPAEAIVPQRHSDRSRRPATGSGLWGDGLGGQTPLRWSFSVLQSETGSRSRSSLRVFAVESLDGDPDAEEENTQGDEAQKREGGNAPCTGKERV